MEFLLLRLEAPLMAFGGPIVDNLGLTRRFPATSMVAGLCANALGLDHADMDSIQNLQDRLRVATRCDRAGELIQDYHTVGFDQPVFQVDGWTTRGVAEKKTAKSTHIRHRSYLADAIYTVALSIETGAPDLDDIEEALRHPARPLFVGRKCCLPARPFLLERRQSAGFREVLESVPRSPRSDRGLLDAWWPGESLTAGRDVAAICDQRDWRNQIHVARRPVVRATVAPAETREIGGTRDE